MSALTKSFSFAELMQLGDILAKSHFFPDAQSQEKAIVKILAGQEMGFGPIASMSGVNVVEGKPELGAHLKAAAIKRSDKYNYSIANLTNEVCELIFFENGEQVGVVRMTIAEATQQGLTQSRGGKPMTNWAKHPDDMLFARCISKGYRRYCPDLTGGVLSYSEGEIETDDMEPQQLENINTKVATHQQEQLPKPKTTEPSSNGKVVGPDTDQVDRIMKLCDELNVRGDDLRRGLHTRFNVDSIRQLTTDQAKQMEDKLRENLALKRANVPSEKDMEAANDADQSTN